MSSFSDAENIYENTLTRMLFQNKIKKYKIELAFAVLIVLWYEMKIHLIAKCMLYSHSIPDDREQYEKNKRMSMRQ